jgi:hypothetical protein
VAYTTYGDLIRASLQEIGVVAVGQRMKDSDAQAALDILLDLIDSWNLDRLTVGTQTRAVFPLVSGDSSYTMGVGGDFAVARPEWIDRGAFILSTDADPVEYHQGPPKSDEAWAQIRMKGLDDSLCQQFRFLDTAPLGTIDVWPVPNVSTISIVLYYPTPLTEPATLATLLSLRPGYRRALRTTLSRELAAGPFPRPLTDEFKRIQTEALAAVKRRNLQPIVMTPDPCMNIAPGQGRFNIFTNSRNR